jgi:hypothetical protein
VRVLRPHPGLEDARRRGSALRLILSGDVISVLLAVIFGLLFMTVAGRRDASATVRDSDETLISADRLERLPFDLEADSFAPRKHQKAAETQRLTARRDLSAGTQRTSALAERRFVAVSERAPYRLKTGPHRGRVAAGGRPSRTRTR